MRFGLPSLFVALVASGPVIAPSARGDEIDDLVNARMEQWKVPGLSLAVVEDGDAVQGEGLRAGQRGAGRPRSQDTIYPVRIGRQAVHGHPGHDAREEWRIGLTDPIDKYFEHAPEAWKAITVQHLLSHTAGISNKLYQTIDMRKDYTDAETGREDRRDSTSTSPPARSGATATRVTSCSASS